MDNIEYIRRTIFTDVPSGASQGYFIGKLNQLGTAPTDDQLRSLMNEIVGNSPQSFRMAQRFGPNTDPAILALFTPGGSINAAPGDNGIPFADPIREQHAVNGEIDLVSEIRAVGNLYNIFPQVDGANQPKNSLSDILGDFTTITLDGNPPSFTTTLASLIGSTPIATGSPSTTITGAIGDLSLILLDGSTPPSSISAAIGPSQIGTSTTITGAIGKVDDVTLDGIAPIDSLAAGMGKNTQLNSDIPVKNSIIGAINSVHSHKAPFLLAFCSAQGDTRGTPIPTPTGILIAQQPYTADMVGLLKLSSITGSTFTGTDQFFTCLHLVYKIAKGKTGSYSVTNTGTPYTNKQDCKDTVGPAITGYLTGEPF